MNDATGPTTPETLDQGKAPAPRTAAAGPSAPRKRISRRALKVWAWSAATIGFVLPWAAFKASARPIAAPSSQQVVVVPAGWRIVSVTGGPGTNGAVKLVAPKGRTAGAAAANAAPPVATTGGSAPPP
jgi:hypothetical protein